MLAVCTDMDSYRVEQLVLWICRDLGIDRQELHEVLDSNLDRNSSTLDHLSEIWMTYS